MLVFSLKMSCVLLCLVSQELLKKLEVLQESISSYKSQIEQLQAKSKDCKVSV